MQCRPREYGFGSQCRIHLRESLACLVEIEGGFVVASDFAPRSSRIIESVEENELRSAPLLTPRARPAADVNADCRVGTADLLAVLASWGQCDACPADLDGDGLVNGTDLMMVIDGWG